MALIKVYRLEHKDTGKGPYQSFHDLSGLLKEAHDGTETHPDPCNKGEPWGEFVYRGMRGVGYVPYDVLYTEVFGFLYLEDLKVWFNDGWLEALEGVGFVIREFMVEDSLVRLGNHQISFVKP